MSRNVMNAKQVQAVNALVRGETVSSAAHLAGVSERQVYRWLHDDVFNGELKRLKSEMLRLAGVRLAALTGSALRVLAELLEDDLSRLPGAGVRLRAAIAVLEMVDRWRQSEDFDERLTALERQAGNVEWY